MPKHPTSFALSPADVRLPTSEVCGFVELRMLSQVVKHSVSFASVILDDAIA